MENGQYDRSILMSAYNYAKWWGKKNGLFESKRVDRALGYLMSGVASEKWEYYGTQGSKRDWYCFCPDAEFGWRENNGYCKHVISKMIDVKYRQLIGELAVQIEMPIEVELEVA